ncbi:nucleoside-diphosphate kinase [Sporolituus thermophilus]|uniref:Nucleoside diphosphate kinase n=1 Tax=Sporolituus thermophilus DSM 23256 TaxID=1123285 RepID=A0A1G7JNK1_9FIRM|nr:nucleoside-diphosphate kinase [Sporolituus thermophilus]SDF26374.1 nucleoside diphosphate kinase [Sporolituus thermophilus DSM 23256]
MEKTLVLIKPDGVARGLCGEIISRFERRGLRILALKMMTLSREQAHIHYAEHQGKPFFDGLIDFITSGPLVAMVVGGENAVKVVRMMMGPTDPAGAAPGTIRGDFALSVGNNVIHGSDSPSSAMREIDLFFAAHEIMK